MDKRTLTEYYENDVPAFGSYDNIRKICAVDGLKLSQRKIIYAAFKRCYNSWLKTDTMCAQTQIDTNYIHGAANLEIVIDNMVANYVGANNYPLLIGNSGGFGCRISPRPSAGRYTRVHLADIAKKLFLEIDNEILEKQVFEGDEIEPKFFVPIFPVMFLNGASGMSTGFSNEILPRNPVEVIEYIKKKIAGTERPRMQLLPWFKGHLGKVEFNKELNRNESFGVVTRNNTTSYTITELPIGTEYQKYVEFLDKLCDNGTIVDYDDKCDPKTDKIFFTIKTTREFTKKHEDERKLYDAFHLVKSLPEVLCCIDENNRVKEFNSIQDILDMFISIRLKFYDKRKKYMLETLKNKIAELVSRYTFVSGIVKKTIVVANKKKDDIIKQIDPIEKIIKIDGSYEYLLRMQISKLTVEELAALKQQILDTKQEYLTIKGTTINDMWINDLSELKKVL